MGETSGYLVDPKSAHALLSVLCRLLAMEIDPRSLQDRAVEMEQVIEKLKEVERDKHNEELSYIG
jgi:proteasome assembly chaperone (PAC2) family protein